MPDLSADPKTTALARFRSALRDSPPLWWSLLYFFSLLSGYYVLRPVRDAMGASGDVLAVFPPWLVDWSERVGFALSDYTLQIPVSYTHLDVYKRQRDSLAHSSIICRSKPSGSLR